MATERYLLGEMTNPELDDFEEHMFVCLECAEAVRTGAEFTENARAIFREHPEFLEAEARETQRERPGNVATFLAKWFPFPQIAMGTAAFALLGFAMFEYTANVRLEREIASLIAQPSQQEITLPPGSRGVGDAKTVPAGVSAFTIILDRVKCASGCTARVRDSGGHFVAGIQVALVTKGSAQLKLTREVLPPGDYTIVVQANGEDEQEYHLRVL
jgi:hypothetical protein